MPRFVQLKDLSNFIPIAVVTAVSSSTCVYIRPYDKSIFSSLRRDDIKGQIIQSLILLQLLLL